MNEIISKLQSGAITLKEAAKELGVSQDELGIILSDKFGYEIADMKAIDYSLADSLPLDMMMKFEILPIKFESNSIYIAMKNPFDTATILKLRNIYSGGTTAKKSKKMKTSEFVEIQRFSSLFQLYKTCRFKNFNRTKFVFFFEPLKKATN